MSLGLILLPPINVDAIHRETPPSAIVSTVTWHHDRVLPTSISIMDRHESVLTDQPFQFQGPQKQ